MLKLSDMFAQSEIVVPHVQYVTMLEILNFCHYCTWCSETPKPRYVAQYEFMAWWITLQPDSKKPKVQPVNPRIIRLFNQEKRSDIHAGKSQFALK